MTKPDLQGDKIRKDIIEGGTSLQYAKKKYSGDLKIVKPAHNKPAVNVKSWAQIKKEALDLREYIQYGNFDGEYNKAYAISHAQIANEPLNFFVINESLDGLDKKVPKKGRWGKMVKKDFGHWCIVNLKIIKKKHPVQFKDACMSFPFRKPKFIKRYRVVKVKYQIPFMGMLIPVWARLSGIPALIAQHEDEHAKGVNVYGLE